MSFFASSKIAARTRFDNVNESEFEKIFQFPPRLLPSVPLCSDELLRNFIKTTTRINFVFQTSFLALVHMFTYSWHHNDLRCLSLVIDCVSQDFYFHQQHHLLPVLQFESDSALVRLPIDFSTQHRFDFISIQLIPPTDITEQKTFLWLQNKRA